jgi:NADH dehydrogenase
MGHFSPVPGCVTDRENATDEFTKQTSECYSAAMLQDPLPISRGAKKVVIIGGGFAGLAAAKILSNHEKVSVTLIDQRNHHLFQPLLYQVATAGLNPADIAVPIRSQFTQAKNVAVYLSQVHRVYLAEKYLEGDEGRMDFDYLIIACGAQHSYFGKSEWEEYAPGLKTLEQATEIRRRILSAFELAENEPDQKKQEHYLTFVIVGGGPTGVELAGAIAEISRTVLINDFKRIHPDEAKVILLEGGARVLGQFSEKLSKRAVLDLTELGVEVRTSSKVTRIDAEGVEIGTHRISAHNAFWAAGVQAARLSKTLNVELDHSGRILIRNDLSIPGHPDIFAVGDIAHLDLGEGNIMPGLAPAAIQTGQAAAKNILASIQGVPRENFSYFDKGQMATIGKHKAVAMKGRLEITGFTAWLAWLFIHVLYLIGFRNRVLVLFEWTWNYFFSKRGARLITSKNWKLES